MSSYCLKFGENTKSTILHVSRAINGGIIILSKCVVCGDKKLKFIKKQEATLLNNTFIRKLLSKIPIFRDILENALPLYKMNNMTKRSILDVAGVLDPPL